jgi:hypothetical protein
MNFERLLCLVVSLLINQSINVQEFFSWLMT